jgi:hypothetical protein
MMHSTIDDALRALQEAAEQAPSIRIELDDSYLHAIAAVEALPQNQSGADKSWVSRTFSSSSKHLAGAVRKT